MTRMLSVAVWRALVVLALVAAPAAGALAQAGAAEQQVGLPYQLPDETGVRWDVQHDGSIGDGGGDQYDGGGHLYLDQQTQFHSRTGVATFSAQRNEVTLAALPYRGLNVSRRIAVNPRLSFCRFAEVLENPTAARINVTLRVHFNMGSSVQLVEPLGESKKTRVIGGAVGDQRHMFAMAWGGRGGKVVPRFQAQPGSDTIDVFYDVEVPARETVVIVHVQAYRPGTTAGAIQFLTDTKEKEYLAQLPKELQKCVVNFRASERLVGDLEVLRGELTDVVELRGGDRLHGTVRERSYKLETFYGVVELPVERVIGLINVGEYRPRQLLVTVGGEVFGGRLAREALSLQLSNGQVLEVPLGEVARMGYRRRPGEPEEWTFERPMMVLGSGERVEVTMPAGEIEVTTRYGRMRLKPETIASIDFHPEEGAAHEIRLTDGSRFAGLVEADWFDMRLGAAPASAAGGQMVRFPRSGVARLTLGGNAGGEVDPGSALLTVSNGDVLAGALVGRVQLETTFDVLSIELDQVKRLSAIAGSPSDVQVTLWDDSVVQGQVPGGQLDCRLNSGGLVRVPAALVADYEQPRPQPPAGVVRLIHQMVIELDADDWRVRDRAQEKLLSLGVVAIKTLRELREGQSPEARHRIDVVLPQLERMAVRGGEGSSSAVGGGAAYSSPAGQFEARHDFLLLDR